MKKKLLQAGEDVKQKFENAGQDIKQKFDEFGKNSKKNWDLVKVSVFVKRARMCFNQISGCSRFQLQLVFVVTA